MSLIARLRELLAQEGLDSLLIHKDTNRRYLSGFTGTSGVLLLTAQENILFTDFRYMEQAAAQAPEFQVVQHGRPLYKTLREQTARLGLKRIGLEKDFVTISEYLEFQQNIPEVDFIPTPDFVERFRRIKSRQELLSLKKAVEIADLAFRHIWSFIQVGQTEREVDFELEFFMRRLGAQRTAFQTIVASGERSALPHGTASTKTIKKNELVTLDFGAVYQGYHSDMTRTLVMGQPDPRQEEIYGVVLKAQEAVLAAVRPGMKACEADHIAREVISQAGYGENFGHGLGHSVGLEIHESPRLAPSDETILEPGMVVSVEPGVYIPGWGGVRIEDLILITPAGCEILTRSPKSMQDMIILS